MKDQHDELLNILNAISSEMALKKLWQSTPPADEALSSTQPFCVDTLTFCEWIQWIMLPKLESMAQSKVPLPNNSDMFSMAEEAFKRAEQDTTTLLGLILQLDNCLRTAH
ncbi:YqcC family protein [Neptunomonas sp.]|uniref:YqcC family protein n=1 Tax=Neptunomonas sp. TaxID=1971898 RepID=UPI0025D284C4|nr:YqcC family protein [Neptunomonas sp.]